MIKVKLTVNENFTHTDIINALSEKLGIYFTAETPYIKLKLGYKDNDTVNLTVAVSLDKETEERLAKHRKKAEPLEDLSLNLKPCSLKHPPVIVGLGPCGLFAGLILARAGLAPVIIERGDSIENRKQKIENFYSSGIIDQDTNIQYGEGGAGAFSDGKVKHGAINKYNYTVLQDLICHGAPEDIIYSPNPHIGTDRLPGIVASIRNEIISLGGTVNFLSTLTDVDIANGQVQGIKYLCLGQEKYIETNNLIVATGHSATDVYQMLYNKGIAMEASSFGIGVRVEHPREYINSLKTKSGKTIGQLGGSYHLVTHLDNGRSVYSFCMCPGGEVVAAASQQSGIVTNGASPYARDMENSNSAILVSITPEDYYRSSPLDGIYYRLDIERKAYAITNSYKAPVLTMKDFMEDKTPTCLGTVKPTYPMGTVLNDFKTVFCEYILTSLKEGIKDFDQWLPGFYYPDSVITGVETRSTSPLKILRDYNKMSISAKGLYPGGEGAGYGGGIISSAVDGVKIAEDIINGLP